MPNPLDYFKGLARGATADLVGGPGDAAEMLANLGLAGYGFLGHQMGLLRPEDMPELLQGSPGTSEWFAKGTPLQDTGTGAYTAGRMTPAVAGLLMGLGRMSPRGPRAPQTGQLRVGGDPDLFAIHQMKSEVVDKGLKELYSPSFAVTNISSRNPTNIDFGGGSKNSIWLVPRVGAFSPREGKTALFNRDAYTARKHHFIGRATTNETVGGIKAYNVRARLTEKGLGKFHQGAYDYPKGTRFAEGVTPESSHEWAIRASPRFQSFKHYEDSPMGAATLLRTQSPEDVARPLYYKGNAALSNALPASTPRLSIPRESASYENLVALARGFEDLDPRGTTYQEAARTALRGLARAPSEYGELKVQGPVQINPEKFAGAVLSYDSAEGPLAMQKALERARVAEGLWGIPVKVVPSSTIISGLHPVKNFGQTIKEVQRAAPPVKGGEGAKDFSRGFWGKSAWPPQGLRSQRTIAPPEKGLSPYEFEEFKKLVVGSDAAPNLPVEVQAFMHLMWEGEAKPSELYDAAKAIAKHGNTPKLQKVAQATVDYLGGLWGIKE